MSATAIERRCAWAFCRHPFDVAWVCAIGGCPAHYCCHEHKRQAELAAKNQGLDLFLVPTMTLVPNPQPTEVL